MRWKHFGWNLRFRERTDSEVEFLPRRTGRRIAFLVLAAPCLFMSFMCLGVDLFADDPVLAAGFDTATGIFLALGVCFVAVAFLQPRKRLFISLGECYIETRSGKDHAPESKGNRITLTGVAAIEEILLEGPVSSGFAREHAIVLEYMGGERVALPLVSSAIPRSTRHKLGRWLADKLRVPLRVAEDVAWTHFGSIEPVPIAREVFDDAKASSDYQYRLGVVEKPSFAISAPLALNWSTMIPVLIVLIVLGGDATLLAIAEVIVITATALFVVRPFFARDYRSLTLFNRCLDKLVYMRCPVWSRRALGITVPLAEILAIVEYTWHAAPGGPFPDHGKLSLCIILLDKQRYIEIPELFSVAEGCAEKAALPFYRLEGTISPAYLAAHPELLDARSAARGGWSWKLAPGNWGALPGLLGAPLAWEHDRAQGV